MVDSIADSNNYLAMNRDPVLRVLQLLESKFDPKTKGGHSLALTLSRGRAGGSKLNHSHGTQFTYVRQTLTLWAEIMGRMYEIWCCADADLLSTRSSYRLCNTGQGLNRVQNCPAVSRVMSDILSTVQRRCGRWVGLSVVHLVNLTLGRSLL